MGGFHATLCPDEVMEYADAIIVGEAENIWTEVINDFEKEALKRRYEGAPCDFTKSIIPDRTLFKGKDYVNVTLLEAGRGCRFSCEFCAIHNFFQGRHYYRDSQTIVKEINQIKNNNKLLFFVDDNIVANQEQAIDLFLAIEPLKISWVGQADITIAKNPDLLDAMVRSGCKGVLIGFESLNSSNLKKMKKGLLPSIKEIEAAIKIIHQKNLRIYATFLFGYDDDVDDDFDRVLEFSIRNGFYIVGFNHLTPFPGTALYKRLEEEGRLLYDKWWLSDSYFYGQVPFQSILPPEIIETECRRIRRKFYGLRSIFSRARNT